MITGLGIQQYPYITRNPASRFAGTLPVFPFPSLLANASKLRRCADLPVVWLCRNRHVIAAVAGIVTPRIVAVFPRNRLPWEILLIAAS